jgi:hypothetical protein
MPAITSRNRILVICLLAVAVLALQPAGALGGNLNPGIHPPTSQPHGLSYTEWSVKWWQWALSIPASQNPLLDPDGTFCHVGQSGHVFFLGSNGGGTNVRSCTIATGQSVLFVAGGALCILNLDADTDAGLQQCVEDALALFTMVSADVDGTPVQDIDSYVVVTPLFNFTLPADNLFGLPPGEYQARAGNWILMTTPLSAGQHVIHFHDEVPVNGFVSDVTYDLTVGPHH